MQLEVREQQNMQEIKRLQKSMSILLEEAGVRTKKEVNHRYKLVGHCLNGSLQVETVREECNKNIDKMAIEIHKLEKVYIYIILITKFLSHNHHCYCQECGERKGQLDQALREKSSLQAELEKVISPYCFFHCLVCGTYRHFLKYHWNREE